MSAAPRAMLRRAGTLSVMGKVESSTIVVRLLTSKDQSFKTIKISSELDMQELVSKVESAFGWREARIESIDGSTLIEGDDELQQAFSIYQGSETARRRDVLEAKLEEIRSALSSRARDVAAHARACHGLWEVACDSTNHKYLSYSIFDHLTASIRSRELRCRNLAAAALWVLASEPATALRLPFGDLVPVLVDAIFDDPCARRTMPKGDEEEEQGGGGGDDNEEEDGRVNADDNDAGEGEAAKGDQPEIGGGVIVGFGGAKDKGALLPRIPTSLAALGALANDNDHQAGHSIARTGYSQQEQRLWCIGALLAGLSTEAGRRAFVRANVALRLLPLLEAPPHRSSKAFKAACALLLAHAAAVTPAVCKSLLAGGSASLVRLVVDGDLTTAKQNSGADWRTQLQAADLLKFALARVRLSKHIESDRNLLDSMPALMGELRAAACPLLESLSAYARATAADGGGGGGEKDGGKDGRGGGGKDGSTAPAGSKEHADRVAKLLRGVMGCMWGMSAALRLAGYVFPAPRGLLAITTALLEYAPERAPGSAAPNEREARLIKLYGGKLRTFALGAIGCLQFAPNVQPISAESDALWRAEQRAFEGACRRNGLEITPDHMPAEATTESVAPQKSTKPRVSSVQSREDSAMEAALAAAREVEDAETHGAFRASSLRALRALTVRFLAHLEESVEQSVLRGVSRVSESYAAALAAIAPMAANELERHGALDRLLAIASRLVASAAQLVDDAVAVADANVDRAAAAVESAKTYNDKLVAEEALEAAIAAAAVAKQAQPEMSGGALRIHSHCLAAVLAIASHGHPGVVNGPSNQGGGERPKHGWSYAEALAPSVSPETAAAAVLRPPRRASTVNMGEGGPAPAEDVGAPASAEDAPAPAAPPKKLTKKQRAAANAAANAASAAPPRYGGLSLEAATAKAIEAAVAAAKHELRRPFRLSPDQLASVLRHSRLSSVAGAADAAAVVWLQACYPEGDALVGSLGGAQVLAALLHEAAVDNKLQGGYAEQASWAAAALWRLCEHPPSAAAALVAAPHALLSSMQQSEHHALRSACLGCIAIMMTRSELLRQLADLGVGGALHGLAGRAEGGTVAERATATRTLNNVANVDGTAEDSAANTDAVSAPTVEGRPSTSESAPTSTTTRGGHEPAVEGGNEVAKEAQAEGTEATAEAIGHSTATTEANENGGVLSGLSLDELFVQLLSDSSPKLRAIGCRGVARSAQQSLTACKGLVRLDAPRKVVNVLRPEVDRLFMHLGMPPYQQPAGAGGDASGAAVAALESDVDGGEVEKGREDGGEVVATQTTTASEKSEAVAAAGASQPQGADGMTSAAAAAAVQHEGGGGMGDPNGGESVGAYELLNDSLNAVLNLSGSKSAQAPLARLGLWTFLELWHASQAQEWSGTLAMVGHMAGETLANLASNSANRTLMYRAELQLKVASWSGAPLRKASLSPRALDGAKGDEMGADAALGGGIDGEREGAAGAEGSGGSGAADASSSDARMRFMDWLGDMEAVEAAEEAKRLLKSDALSGEGPGGDDGPSSRVLLARAAFTLMDQNEDGELSRFEMVRAFRLDERVRELMLPLLPMPAVSKQSITGVDLQQQIDAFEDLFKAMDSDGSDGIDKFEFETFFKRTETKKRRSGDAAASRRRLLAPLRPDLAPSTVRPGGLRSRAVTSESLPPPLPPTTRVGRGGRPGVDTTKAPKLARMLRLNAIDTWRKPLVEQVPPTPTGPPRPTIPRRTQTPVHSSSECELHPLQRCETAASSAAGHADGLGLGAVGGSRGASRRSLAMSQSLPALGLPNSRSRDPVLLARTTVTRPSTVGRPKGNAFASRMPTTVAEGGGPLPASASLAPHSAAGEEVVGSAAGPAEAMAAAGAGTAGLPQLLAAAPSAAMVVPPLALPPLAAGGDDPWCPHVTDIEVFENAADGEADGAHDIDPAMQLSKSGDLSAFERAYLQSVAGDRLNFQIKLPEDEQYTPRFHFHPAAGQKGAKKGPSGKLVSWKATDGSRVGDSVAPSFTLPNGTTMRFFHRENRRNAIKPKAEPDERRPDSLDALGMGWLPARPSPPRPTEADVPRLEHSAELIPPKPIVATLVPYTAPAPEFGVIEVEPFTLGVVEPMRVKTPASSADAVDGDREEKKGPPLVLEKSVFANRRRTSDGHSYFATPAIVSRAFEIDWSRCNNPRFRTLIGRQDDGGWEMLAQEMNEIREVLSEYSSVLYSAYSYYCAEESCHDGYAMGLPAYFVFLNDIKVVEEDSSHCSANHLESIFLATNIEDKGSNIDFATRDLNRVNSNEALMRFEFMQCLVRIAIAKYVRPKIILDTSDALAEFMERDVLPNLTAAAKHDDNVFRRERLYTRSVDEVFAKYGAALQTIFNFYALPGGHMIKEKARARDAPEEASLSIDEWMTFLTDSRLLYESETEMIADARAFKRPGYVSEFQARLCHTWSIAFCSDELRRRNKYTTANYVDFLEAIARLTTFMPLPNAEQLVLYNEKSAMDFLDGIENGRHDGSALLKGETTWESEEVSQEDLAPPLEMLINLILDRLDKDGSIQADPANLDKLRTEREARQQRFLLQREGSTMNEKVKKPATVRR